MLYQTLIDAITNITILAILFFVNDTYRRKFGYIMLCILLGLFARQLDVDQTLTGVTNWTNYFNSIESNHGDITPFIILILTIPVLVAVYFKSDQNIMDSIIYGGLPMYGILLLTVVFLFNKQSYHALISFDDLFIQINNAIGDMAPKNVIPFYFSLFIPFIILGFVFVYNQDDILFIKGLYIAMILMYVGFITYTIDYSK